MTPPLNMAAVLQDWIAGQLESMHTCIPGRIEKYDAARREAQVLPLLNLRLQNGASIEYKPISGVPVQFPSGSTWGIHGELVSGDLGLILFSEASLGNYLNGTGLPVNPEDHTRFSLQDAIFIPGVWPWAKVPASVPSTGLYLNYKGTSAHFSDSGLAIVGDVTVTGKVTASDEVTAMNAAPAAAVKLSTHTHPTPAGPSSPPVPGS